MGNLIPRPRNLILWIAFSKHGVIRFLCSYLVSYPFSKKKKKVIDDSETKPFLTRDEFSKTRKHIFCSKSRQPVDRLRVLNHTFPILFIFYFLL